MTTAESEGPLWESAGDPRRKGVQSVFADIAPCYDKLNRLMSLGRDKSWREAAVDMLGLQPGDRVLDVCTGTGDFLLSLQNRVGVGNAFGLDFCLPMLKEGKRMKSIGPLVQGDGCKLPFASGSFSGLTVGWGLRNVPDYDAAVGEMVRVLRPGAAMVSVDMAIPKNLVLARLSGAFLNSALPVLGALFRKRAAYTYLPKSAEMFFSREEQAARWRAAGLIDVRWEDRMLGNICIHFGRKPWKAV